MEIAEMYFQAITIGVAVVTFVVSLTISSRKERKNSNREIYQRLELASIEFFRFEADHLPIIKHLWEKKAHLPEEGTAERIAVNNYVCQMLNLFEMAFRFRRENIMATDVFFSWLQWIYDLCKAPHFAVIWKGIRQNYTKELRDLLDKNADMANSPKGFKDFVTIHFNSKLNLKLLDELGSDE